MTKYKATDWWVRNCIWSTKFPGGIQDRSFYLHHERHDDQIFEFGTMLNWWNVCTKRGFHDSVTFCDHFDKKLMGQFNTGTGNFVLWRRWTTRFLIKIENCCGKSPSSDVLALRDRSLAAHTQMCKFISKI